jgi:hypothetical protein
MHGLPTIIKINELAVEQFNKSQDQKRPVVATKWPRYKPARGEHKNGETIGFPKWFRIN